MVNDQIEDRLPSISDQIMSRSRLERVITDFDLYAEQRARGMIMEDVVAAMRKDIVVGIEGRGKQSFRVSYESDEREHGAQGDRAPGVALHRGEPQGQGQPGSEHERVPGVGARGDARRRCSRLKAGSRSTRSVTPASCRRRRIRISRRFRTRRCSCRPCQRRSIALANVD